MPRRYLFAKSLIHRVVVNVVDFIGAVFFHNSPQDIDLTTIRSVCFVQLAHIGDLILTLPTIAQFKERSGKFVILAVSKENEEIAKELPFVDKVIVVSHPAFFRHGRFSLRFIKEFRKISADLAFELRGDIRIIPLLRYFSRCKSIVGFDVDGGAFLLDKVLPYPYGQHITKTYDLIFSVFGITPMVCPRYVDLIPDSGFSPSFSNYICIAVGAGAHSRRWGVEKFVKVSTELSKKYPVVLIGKVSCSEEKLYVKSLGDRPNINLLLNKTEILDAISIVKKSVLFIGLESGFTHIAALSGVKTVALWGSATMPAVWNPLAVTPGQIALLSKRPSCAGCGRAFCEDNICMQSITVDAVLAAVDSLSCD